MNFQEYWQMLKDKLKNDITEDSPAFIEYLKKNNLETEIINIPYYSTFSDFLFEIHPNSSIIRHYTFIDKSIYNEVSQILLDEGASNLINEICSILKKGYYQSALADLNATRQARRFSFLKQLPELYNHISNENLQITFTTNKKKEIFKIENEDLINFVRFSIVQNLENQDFRNYIFSAEDSPNKNINLSDFYVNVIALDLINIIESKGIFKNGDFGNFIQNKFTNKSLELTYTLLQTAGLIVETQTTTSLAKDYLRTRLLRFITKNYTFDANDFTLE